MSGLKFNVALTVLLLIVLPEFGTLAWSKSKYFPTKCKKFTDKRTEPIAEDGRTVLVVSRHLTNNKLNDIRFFLEEYRNLSYAAQQEELCNEPYFIKATLKGNNHEEDDHDYDKHTLIIPSSLDMEDEEPEPETLKAAGSIQTAPELYFIVDGYVYENYHFYSPNDYCVSAISDDEVILKACSIDCSADLSTSYLYTSKVKYSPSRVCIPMCCGLGKTLKSAPGKNLDCRNLNNEESFYFMPYLHLQNSIPNEEKKSILVSYSHNSNNRRSFNDTAKLPGSLNSIWDRLHFYTPTLSMRCKYGHTYEPFSLKDIQTGVDTSRLVQVAVLPGHARLQYWSRSRQWISTADQYCIEGVDNWGKDLLKNEVSMIAVKCAPVPSPDPEVKLDLPPVLPQDWILIGLSIFAVILLIIILITYLGLCKTLTSQEHLILSHCASVTLLYILGTAVRLSYLTFDKLTGGNVALAPYEPGDGKNLEHVRVGSGCIAISIFHHYFQFTTYFWLTMMNYDIWRRVPLLRVAKNRNISNILTYSAISWGIPAVFIIIFVILDECWNDPFAQVVVPDYAKEYCTVASWSAGYYVHLPIFLLLLLNFVLIANRLDRYCRKKCWEDGGESFSPKSMTCCSRGPYVSRSLEIPTFSPTIFALLWGIHLVAWLIDLAQWMKLFRNQNYELDYFLVTAQSISLVGVPILLFHLYCMNTSVLERTGSKFKPLKGVTTKLRSSGWAWTSGFSTEKKSCGTPERDDVIVVESVH